MSRESCSGRSTLRFQNKGRHNDLPYVQLDTSEEEQECQCSVGISLSPIDGLGAVPRLRTDVSSV